MTEVFALDPAQLADVPLEDMPPLEMSDTLRAMALKVYEEKEQALGFDPSILRRVERDIMLQILDAQWKDHLYSLDHLKEGIGLRGYGQRDPLVEYKRESFDLFQAMKDRVEEDIVRYLWRIRPVIQQQGEGEAGESAAPAPPPPPVARPPARKAQQLTFSGGSSTAGPTTGSRPPASPGTPLRPARTGGDDAEVKTVRRDEPKVGRNDPCWCGSGKKYKKCHGA
jgi:preprotein translocase subunit SecA